MFKKITVYIFLLLFLSVCCVSCAAEGVLSPNDYTQLLLSVKHFFVISSIMLSTSDASNYGQAISRMYYGCYHIARLIFNNTKGYDGRNHTQTWEAMPNSFKSYGQDLKKMRIKYDYDPYSVKENELYEDLKYIYDQRVQFDNMLQELNKSIVHYSTNPFFIKEFEKNIKEVQDAYASLVADIKRYLP